jgi:hypothetical protein
MKKTYKNFVNQNINIIDQNLFYEMVNDQLIQYQQSPNHHFVIEKAKKENWLGSQNPKDNFGLLGYMRENIALQLKLLQRVENPIGIYFSEFVSFFRSNFFKNRVLENNHISFKLHATLINNKNIDYLEIIKNKTNFNFNEFSSKFNNNN